MLKINFWFFIVLSLMLLSGDNSLVVCSIYSALFHELGHLLFILITKQKINSLTFDACVININLKSDFSTELDNLLISSGGCLFNLIFLIVSVIFGLDNYIVVNLSLLIFNLLPIYGLDGYDILLCTKIKHKYLNVISLIFNVILLLFGLLLIYFKNYTILIISIYLLILKKHSIK